MRAGLSRPSAGELFSAPELAVLGVIEVSIDMLIVALTAAHPEPGERHENGGAFDAERRAGRALIGAARELASAIRRYRTELAYALERERDDILPF